MIDVHNRKCRTEGCGKLASFGVAGAKTREYCAQHALDGMVDVKNRKCRTEGCYKLASFEVAGTKTAEYCARHSLDGMVQVRSRKYKTKRCGKKPLFGVADTRAAEYGAQHTKRTSVRPPPTKISHPSGASRGSRKRIRHPEITSTASKRAVAREPTAGVVTMPDIDGKISSVKQDCSVKMEVQLSL